MVGSDQVLRGVSHHSNAEFHVLVPNEKGYEASQAAGAKVIAVFAAASEGFSRANINCTVAESIERFKPVLARARADGIKVRGYISCVLGCMRARSRRRPWSCRQRCGISSTLATTPSAAPALNAASVRPNSGTMQNLAMHFHDTTARRWPISAGMEEGCHVMDSAEGWLGGCPYGPGATGNVATEGVVYMLEGLGIAMGVDMAKLLAATNEISRLIGRPPVSRVASALNAKRSRS